MHKSLSIFKGRPEYFWDEIFAQRMYRAWKRVFVKSRQDYLPYDVFRSTICRSFQITSNQAMQRLRFLQEKGLVTIGKRGVILNYEVKNE